MWLDERWKVAHRGGAKHISKLKCTKHTSVSTFGSWDVQKVHTVVARSTFRSQNFQKLRGSGHFSTFRCRFAWQAQGIVHLVKSEQKREGCEAFPKRWQAWDIWRGPGKMHFPWQAQYKRHVHQDVRRSGPWFPERGCILEHQIFSFGKMILCDRCSTSYDLASIFRGRRNTLDQWKNRKTQWYEAVSPFLKEVSQNCFIFDVVNWKKLRKSCRIASFLTLSSSKNWGSLAELLRFWCCQVQQLRMSHRIASFSNLQIDRWIDRSIDRYMDRSIDQSIDRSIDR